MKDGDLHLIYTDHRKNLHITDLDKLKEADNPKDSQTAIFHAQISEEGEVVRNIISEKNKINGYLIPTKSLCENDEYLINVGNRSKVMYGKIVF